VPYSPDIIDSSGIENIIREMVRNDFSQELDFSRHQKFDENPFYPAPKVDQILKDSDKVDYRRLSDQHAEAKYTLNQVVQAYREQISIQDQNYIIKSVQKPTNCHYQRTGPGNFGC
jgi:hypothetical protein